MNIYYITVIKDQEPRHTLAEYLWLTVYHESSRWLGCRTIWRLGCVCTRGKGGLCFRAHSCGSEQVLVPTTWASPQGFSQQGSFVFRFSISFFPPTAFFRYTIQWFVAYSELCHQTFYHRKKIHYSWSVKFPMFPNPNPSSRQTPTYFLTLHICACWTFHVNVIIQYVAFVTGFYYLA